MFASDIEKIKIFGGEFISNTVGGVTTLLVGFIYSG